LKEFSRVVSTAEGAAFAASRDPPWLFMECSAKKGGEDIVGYEGLFGKVVDKVRLLAPAPTLVLILTLSSFLPLSSTPVTDSPVLSG
jgi:hypothetical protein